MKLAPLLAQFFYTNKRLDLPGIGSFELDPATTIDQEGKVQVLEGATFENKPGIRESPELVAYIASRTGKIKALAAADLDSHLELARQFLNIGKPFLFEGIGYLAKLQAGGYQFTPGNVSMDRWKETAQKELVDLHTEDVTPDYKDVFYNRPVKKQWRRPVAATLILVGIGLAVWGGYVIYERTKKKSAVLPEETKLVQSQTVPDTMSTVAKKTDTVTAAPGTYKFVVETADRDRGLKRYNYLKNNGLAIEMETDDSVDFRLYFRLAASAADTTRMMDSLRNFYTPPGKKAYVLK